jgi:hypothetical protein
LYHWKGSFRKCFKGSFEHNIEVSVPTKRENFRYFKIYELLRKGYAAGRAMLQEGLCCRNLVASLNTQRRHNWRTPDFANHLAKGFWKFAFTI